MIEAGKSFCPHCVETHEGAYYGNASLGWGVWLKHSRFGGKYRVEAEDFGRESAPASALRLLSTVTDADKGVPDAIVIGDTGSGEEYELDRVCPVCAQKRNRYTRVLREVGKYPTFVIAMIGDTAAGKSAWLDAVAMPINTNDVNKLNYPHRLEYITRSHTEMPSVRTLKESRGQTKLLEILDKETRKIVALVYLVDVGGELYRPDHQVPLDPDQGPRMDEKVIRHLLKGHMQYPGADAFVFVEPAVTVKKKDNQGFSAGKIYGELHQEGYINGKPLAYVLTHADKLIKQGKFRAVRGFNHTQEVPIMTDATFSLDERTSYRREDMLSRMALEDAIVRAYDSPILDSDNAVARGFLVRSCDTIQNEVENEQGMKVTELVENLRVSLNVMDPLLWILNQLKLFPLKESE